MNAQTQIDFNIHSNSLCAYRDKILPTLSGRKLEVFNAIKSLGGECTGWDLINYLQRPYHKFSGRLTQLKKAGIIEDTGVNKVINGSTYSILKIK